MKQGLYFHLPIRIGMDVKLIERMEFIFQQGNKTMTFEYPSERATSRDNENIIDLKWTKDETYFFDVGNIKMDSRITLKDSDDQPVTKIVNVHMDATLFEQGES